MIKFILQVNIEITDDRHLPTLPTMWSLLFNNLNYNHIEQNKSYISMQNCRACIKKESIQLVSREHQTRSAHNH